MWTLAIQSRFKLVCQDPLSVVVGSLDPALTSAAGRGMYVRTLSWWFMEGSGLSFHQGCRGTYIVPRTTLCCWSAIMNCPLEIMTKNFLSESFDLNWKYLPTTSAHSAKHPHEVNCSAVISPKDACMAFSASIYTVHWCTATSRNVHHRPGTSRLVQSQCHLNWDHFKV